MPMCLAALHPRVCWYCIVYALHKQTWIHTWLAGAECLALFLLMATDLFQPYKDDKKYSVTPLVMTCASIAGSMVFLQRLDCFMAQGTEVSRYVRALPFQHAHELTQPLRTLPVCLLKWPGMLPCPVCLKAHMHCNFLCAWQCARACPFLACT